MINAYRHCPAGWVQGLVHPTDPTGANEALIDPTESDGCTNANQGAEGGPGQACTQCSADKGCDRARYAICRPIGHHQDIALFSADDTLVPSNQVDNDSDRNRRQRRGPCCAKDRKR